eukprot:2200825-Pyramimonas_sp.AAC.1
MLDPLVCVADTTEALQVIPSRVHDEMHHVDNIFQLANFMHDKVIDTEWEGLAFPVPAICPNVRFDDARLDPKYESTATWAGPFRRDVTDESLNPACDVCRAVPDEDEPL